ncbi:hypothetical protein V2A60_000653 [Cordyceps javanica]
MDCVNDEECARAATEHHLSNRGASGFTHRDVWGPREKSMGNPWSPTNPDGTVILRLAENCLMHEDIARALQEKILALFWKKLSVCPSKHLTYSTGPRGSRRLRQALVEYYTDEFNARELTVDNVFITCGLASAIDALAWATCNDGEGILVPLPLYNGFTVDILNRSNARVVGITYTDIEGYSGIDSIFRPDLNTRALEAALSRAYKEGVTLRALLISK